MWALRDHRYGGRAKRYTSHPWGVVRCVDPISAMPLSFPTELHYENWLLHYARSDIVAIDAQPVPLEYVEAGRRHKARFDVLLRLHTGVTVAQLVMRESSAVCKARCNALEVATRAHGFICEPRPRELIRANLILLNNLGRLRQLLAVHADTISQHILHALKRQVLTYGTVSRKQLLTTRVAKLVGDPQRIDAALFKLFVARQIKLNLHEVMYDDHTQISSPE